MARLKEMKDATLLRFYLKLEKYLPDALMGIAGQGVKAIVGTLQRNLLKSSPFSRPGDPGSSIAKLVSLTLLCNSGAIRSCG